MHLAFRFSSVAALVSERLLDTAVKEFAAAQPAADNGRPLRNLVLRAAGLNKKWREGRGPSNNAYRMDVPLEGRVMDLCAKAAVLLESGELLLEVMHQSSCFSPGRFYQLGRWVSKNMFAETQNEY
jgi:hypothetical protein